MAKEELTVPCLLMHFDQDRELALACDASLYGVGAVLSHRWLMEQIKLSHLYPVNFHQWREIMLNRTRKP